jgi:hypothetical protein
MIDGGDDFDKWIEHACGAAGPIDPTDFIDDEEDGRPGPPLSKDEIRQAWERLAKWQSPDAFQSDVAALCKRCNSSDWFNRPRLKFLHDAFVLAEFVGHRPVDQVRLTAPLERWPDGCVRIGKTEHNVEVTSEHGGRKLGDEYANVTGPRLVDSIAAPPGKIGRRLDSAIQGKVDKRYGSRAWLVVYLNIHDWFGIRQSEAEHAIKGAKQKDAASFREIFVLWKDKML